MTEHNNPDFFPGLRFQRSETEDLEALCREAEVHVVYTHPATPRSLVENDPALKRSLQKIIELKLDYMKSKNPRYAVEAFLFVCALRKRQSVFSDNPRRPKREWNELKWLGRLKLDFWERTHWYLTEPEWVIEWLGGGFLTYHDYWETNVFKNIDEREQGENRLEQILGLRPDFSGGKHCYKPDQLEYRNLTICRELLFLSKCYGIPAEGEGIEIISKRWVNDLGLENFPQASILEFYRKSPVIKVWKKDPNFVDSIYFPTFLDLCFPGLDPYFPGGDDNPWAKLQYLKDKFPIEDITLALKRKIIKKLFSETKEITPQELELEVKKHFE